MSTLGFIFKRQLIREFTLCRLQMKQTLNGVLFFVMVVVFFPLSLPSQTTLIMGTASGVLWIALLLSTLLSSEKLYQEDLEEGVIEQWLISGYPMSLFIFTKLLANWVWLVVPLLIFSPLLGVIYSISGPQIGILMLSFLVGSPALLALGGLANAFTQGVKQKGLLMALILMPLTLPILIFGSGVLNLFIDGAAVEGYLALLLSFSILAMGLLPFAIAAIFKSQV